MDNSANQNQNQVQNQSQSQAQNQNQQDQGLRRSSLKIGIIVNEANLRDIEYYKEEFKKINAIGKDKIELIFIGYRPDLDFNNSLEGVTYKYVKPVSIIHYFKMLSQLGIHLMFIPLINDKYNQTSENINKYFECSLLNIPIIVNNMFPYNKFIGDKQNGFLYENRETFISYLFDVLKKDNIGLLKLCAGHAKDDVKKNYCYSEHTINLISDLFPKI